MEKLVLLDSNSLLNRAFYALPPMNSIDGRPTNAVYGYINMLLKIINDVKPTNIIATFDLKAPTFRKELYQDYKATRKAMPEELVAQVPIIKELLQAMNIQIISLEGYEADDLIGTLARQCDGQTIIVTGDKDSLQLISPSTTVWLTKRGITEIIEYNESRLMEDGLTPSGVIDLKSLMGDSSDNIPGVAGIGEKTAKDLLSKYNNLDGVYEHIDEIKGKLHERLVINKEMAYLSYKLATINVDSPVEFDDEASRLVLPFSANVKELMTNLSFKSIVNRLTFDVEVGESSTKSYNVADSIVIDNENDMLILVKKIQEAGQFSILVSKDIHLSIGDGREYLCVVGGDLLSQGLSYDSAIDIIKPLLNDSSIRKVGYDIKTLFYQIESDAILNYDDIAVKMYLCDANRNYKNLDEAILDYGYSSDDYASIILDIESTIDTKMKEYNLVELYENVELPLIKVLYNMESYGIRVDISLMNELREKFSIEIASISHQIFEYNNNVAFNLNSPKQLGVFLFETLGLKHGKKTKTGYSTGVDVLESLSGESEVVAKILRYRELTKLLSTYIDGLQPLIKGDRIHTIFKQTVTATGRLSSTEPNLQNIPIRKVDGRELRKMFIASNDSKLLCADYSQIELRLMAHYSGDKILLKAFEDGEDIHTLTASKAFNVPISQVTQEMRRQAKAVNFGIIYGISDYGLASDIGVPTWKAKEFIEKYFLTYPSIKAFMDSSVKEAHEKGYITTLMNRIRFVPEVKSTNYNIRQFGERIAMNMPLQGSASDIIKMAMLNVDTALRKGGYKAQLVLQVHDELLIDCPNSEVTEVAKLLKSAMTNAIELRVKLVAEVSQGDNWLEAK